ncbi:DUF397 domain-containing protein [Streptomyces sp. NPDC018031]|uniref:DUF397 domain-containing protein n=1 Tax=Streptomyces sp. NPDC018031 TaxID=3365033 RepID=UPI003792C6ED
MPTSEWRKSTYSADAGNCVNIATGGQGDVRLRESDEPGTVLATTPAVLGAFIRAARRGDFDRVAPRP